MRTLQQVLNEVMQELYHFTDGRSLALILKKDTFRGSRDDGFNPKGYGWFMSTTRSQNAAPGYPAAYLQKDICKIVIDGQALNSRYKIMPVNFQGNVKAHAIRDMWDDPKYFDDYKDERMRQPYVEAEDRVLLKSDTIPNFHRYIKRIFLDTNTIGAKDAVVIIQYAERYDIPVDVTLTTKQFTNAH